jgi:hypothetical protein
MNRKAKEIGMHDSHFVDSPASIEWHLLKPKTTVIPANAGIQAG